MLIAITGTPGTGKSSVCDVLAGRGYAVVDLDALAREEGLIRGRDEARDTEEVDVDGLRDRLRVPSKLAFLKSHYSHRMRANIAIVLRCRPRVLRERLEARGWSTGKVTENVEAEAVGVILQEAVDSLPFVYEVDTTSLPAASTADAVLAILKGQTKGYEPGSAHWTSDPFW